MRSCERLRKEIARAREACSATSASSRTRRPRWSRREREKLARYRRGARCASADRTEVWLETPRPWPEEFGLGRMRALLDRARRPAARLPGDPRRRHEREDDDDARVEALLRADGLSVGAYTSPHVLGWARADPRRRREADIERALGRVRPAAERIGATQFEVAHRRGAGRVRRAEVDAAVVEAGLGGRLDATNVLGAQGRRAHERRPRAHRGARARRGRRSPPRSSPCRRRGRRSSSASPSGRRPPARRARRAVVVASSNPASRSPPRSRSSAAGRSVRRGRRARFPAALEHVARSRSRSGTERTTSPASGGSLARLPTRRYASSPRSWRTRTPTECSRRSRALGDTFVATVVGTRARSPPTSSPPGRDVLRRGRDRAGARGGARASAARPPARRRGPRHRVALPARRSRAPSDRRLPYHGDSRRALSVFALAAIVLALIVALSFAAGWFVGKILS